MEQGCSFPAGGNGNCYNILKMQWETGKNHTNVQESFDPDSQGTKKNKLFNSIKNLHA